MKSIARRSATLLLLLTFALSGLAASSAFAAPPPAPPGPAPVAPPAPPGGKKYTLVDPLNSGGGNIQLLAGRAIKIVTGISGSIGLLMFIFGGFTWLTSAGNPDKVKKGKQIFVTASVGLLIVFGSYALLSLLFRALGGVQNL